MKQVMKMKKAMIVLLIVLLVMTILLAGLFFWKGGHHAIRLVGIMDEWLEADEADSTLSLDLSGLEPGSDGKRSPKHDAPPLEASLFWTEYSDEHLFGLTVEEVTTWTDGKNLYMESGASYALPSFSALKAPARKLMLVSFLLFGRVTRDDDTYRICMTCGGLEVNVDIVADRSLEAINASIELPDGTGIAGSLVTGPKQSHDVPREISDAIVRAEMAPPAPLGEPISILFPAFENLLPLHGELTLTVEGSIDEIAETMDFTMDRQAIELEEDGELVTIDLPAELAGADPSLLSLLILQYGSYDFDDDTAEFVIKLEKDATTMLCNTLAPQISDRNIEFHESEITLTIEDGVLTSVNLSADGDVSLVFETTPVCFEAELITD